MRATANDNPQRWSMRKAPIGGYVLATGGILWFVSLLITQADQQYALAHNPGYTEPQMPWWFIGGGIIALACYIYALHEASSGD